VHHVGSFVWSNLVVFVIIVVYNVNLVTAHFSTSL